MVSKHFFFYFYCRIHCHKEFLKICYGLQMRPPTSFIGYSRRKRRFDRETADSKHKICGLHWAYPEVPGVTRGYPGLPGYPDLAYMGLSDVSEDFLWKKFVIYFEKSPVDGKSPNWLLWYKKFLQKSPICEFLVPGTLRFIIRSPICQIWVPG